MSSIVHEYVYSWKSTFLLFFYIHSLNKIVPDIRYGQTTFTILKTDKLSMLHVSLFYTKYDNSVTNNTFPTDMLRQNNNTKFTPICYTCTQFTGEVKLFQINPRKCIIHLGWISTLIYSFHHKSYLCGWLSSYKQKSHISDLIMIYAKIKIDWETLNVQMWSSTILHVDVLIHFRK